MPHAAALQEPRNVRQPLATPGARQSSGPTSLIRTLRSVLNLPVQARGAEPLALVSGATVGAAMAWAINGGAQVLSGTIFGVGLSGIALLVMRAIDGEHRDHQARREFLNRYAGTREMLAENALEGDEATITRAVYDQVTLRLGEIVSSFHEHCLERGTPFNELMGNVLTEFYLTHCAQRDACVVFNESRGCYYIAAIPHGRTGRVREQIGIHPTAGRNSAISAIFRNAGAIFMRADLVSDTLRQRTSYQIEEVGEEWRVMNTNIRTEDTAPRGRDATQTAAAIMPEPYTQARHVKRHTADREARSPPATGRTERIPAAGLKTFHGVTMVEQWSLLPLNGVTHRHIRAISADLEKGRVHGHPVRLGTLKCTASDLNMEGLPGRGIWRLLHRRTADGIELIGIADYHETGRKPLVWWTG